MPRCFKTANSINHYINTTLTLKHFLYQIRLPPTNYTRMVLVSMEASRHARTGTLRQLCERQSG